MKSVDHDARLKFPTASPATVASSSMVVCPAVFLEQMTLLQQSYMAAMYRVAYEAAQRSVEREAFVRRWSEPSMN